MLNEIGVKIKLVCSKDAFCLMGATAAKVKIVHASMFVRKVKLMSSVFLDSGERNCKISRTPRGV